MPTTDHARNTARLRSAITRTRNAAKAAPLLADKISLLAKVKRLEQELRAHCLDAYANAR